MLQAGGFRGLLLFARGTTRKALPGDDAPKIQPAPASSLSDVAHEKDPEMLLAIWNGADGDGNESARERMYEHLHDRLIRSFLVHCDLRSLPRNITGLERT